MVVIIWTRNQDAYREWCRRACPKRFSIIDTIAFGRTFCRKSCGDSHSDRKWCRWIDNCIWHARKEDRSLVKLLRENGVDINGKNNDGKTLATHPACLKGHLEMTQLLMGNGADLQAKDNDGFTPWYSACVNDLLDVAEPKSTQ